MDKKFKCLSKDMNSERMEWVYYGIMSKPHVIGGSWITPDLQFTGLKDKNGKEIYEGDIVRNEDGEISYVDYHRHGFWVHDEGFGWEGEGLWDWDEMEIIGNIYENIELLNKEQNVQVSDTTMLNQGTKS